MKVRVIQRHEGEGAFPVFKKGTQVILGKETDRFPHWYACEIEGRQTYIADAFVNNGRLLIDYDPTELVQEVGDVLEVREVVYDWLLAKNEIGITGWIPMDVSAVVDDSKYELWDVLDANGKNTGRLHVRGQPMATGDYHLIVHVWKRNKEGEWLINKRAILHGHSSFGNIGGKWETTGGCAVAGDDSLSAALRETKEELGLCLDAKKGKLWKRIPRYGNDGHTWFTDVWIFEHDCIIEEVILQENETTAAMWASTETIFEMMAAGEFIGDEFYPYFKEMVSEYSGL